MLVAQLRPTLCNCIDCSWPGSSVLGILSVAVLECVAIPSSRRSSQTWEIPAFLLLTQGSNPGLPHGGWILYRLPPGKPSALPFNHASCWSRQHKGCQPGLPTTWSFAHSTLYLLRSTWVSSSQSRFISDHAMLVTSTMKPKAAFRPSPRLDWISDPPSSAYRGALSEWIDVLTWWVFTLTKHILFLLISIG